MPEIYVAAPLAPTGSNWGRWVQSAGLIVGSGSTYDVTLDFSATTSLFPSTAGGGSTPLSPFRAEIKYFNGTDFVTDSAVFTNGGSYTVTVGEGASTVSVRTSSMAGIAAAQEIRIFNSQGIDFGFPDSQGLMDLGGNDSHSSWFDRILSIFDGDGSGGNNTPYSNDSNNDGRSDGSSGGNNGGGSGGNGGNGGNGGGGGGTQPPPPCNNCDGGGGPKAPPGDSGPGDQASPLVLDLDGDGIELSSVGFFGSYFDLLGNGQAVRTGWVEPDDALLALDVNADGVINDITELFGNANTDGFTMLAVHDSNGDGVIDANDTVFSDLLVWQDTNSDGYSQSTELSTLSDVGITSINLDSTRLPNVDNAGNSVTHESTYTMTGGIERQIVDVWFAYDPSMTRNIDEYTFDVRTAFLPTLRAYGDLKNLHQAASIDNGVDPSSLIEQLITLSTGRSLVGTVANWDAYIAEVDALLLNWAGVDNVVANSRGEFVDAQHLAFYEAWTGEAFDQYGRSNPLQEAGDFVEAIYQDILTNSATNLLTQIDGGSVFTAPSYDLYYGGTQGDLTVLQSGIDAIKGEAIAAIDGTAVWAQFARFLGYAKGLDNLTAGEITALDAAVLATGEVSLSNWQDVVSLMTVTLGQVINSSADWGSFEVFYDNLQTGTSGDDTMSDSFANSNSELKGLAGNDILDGLEGHDKLEGGLGDDTLIGGLGDDFLLGGAGNDIYIYDSGNDTISEEGNGGNDELHIAASTGLTQANLQDMYRYGNDLIILFDNNDFITVHDYNQTDSGIEKIVFLSDASEIDLAALITEKFYGTDKADNFTVSGQPIQTLLTYGFDGNDTLTVSGSSGEVYGGNGYDTLIGDYLSDELHGETEDDYLFGAGGADTLYGDDGNDYLDGGIDNDLLYGGAGNDTFVYGAGYGDDIIKRSSLNTSQGDRVSFNSSISPNDLVIVRVDNPTARRDLTFEISATGETLVVDDQFAKSGSEFYNIENFKFADGTLWNGEDVRNKYIADNTTNGDDVIVGFEFDENFLATAGDDYIKGYSGADTYNWGSGMGNDRIYDQVLNFLNGDGDTINFNGLTSSDVTFSAQGEDLHVINNVTGERLIVEDQFKGSLYRIESFVFSDITYNNNEIYDLVFNSGSPNLIIGTPNADTLFGTFAEDDIQGLGDNDVIYGDDNNDKIYGDDGDDTLRGDDGDDIVDGGAGNDNIRGGKGNDTLSGGEGDDSIRAGSGDDYITYTGGLDTIIQDTFLNRGGNDTLRFGNNISAYDLTFEDAPSNDTRIILNAGVDEILIEENNGNSNYRIEILEFDDGLTLDFTDYNTWYWDPVGSMIVTGSAGDDTILANGGDDVVNAGAGNDQVHGDEGDDILNGQSGDDRLHGGTGNDTLIYTLSENIGNTDIYDGDYGSDTLELYFTTAEYTTTVQNDVTNFFDFADQNKQMNSVFGNSFSFVSFGLTVADIEELNIYVDGVLDTSRFTDVQAGAGSTTTNGTSARDIVTGNNQSETLKGLEGSDIIYGQNGADLIYGNQGNDVIYGGGWADTIFGDGGWNATYGGNDTIYGEAGNDLVNGRAGDDYIDGGVGHDTLRGQEGDDIIYGGVGSDNLDGGDDDDMLYGEEGSDTLLGGSGDDFLYGGALNDLLKGDDGNDYLDGGVGNDNLQGGLGIDQLYGRENNDFLYGGGDNDTLSGGAGFDKLYGDDGDDILFGDAGWDYLTGGAGADTFIFSEFSDYQNNQYNRVRDLNVNEDQLDISGILDTIYNPLTDILSDFVQVVDTGVHTYIRIDQSGSGAAYNSVAMLEGYTGSGDNAQDMVDNGYLVV